MDIESTAVVIDGKQWEKDLPECGDLEVLVAPWDNAAFEKELNKRIRALPPGLRADGQVDPAAYYRCVGSAIVKAILFDWRNLYVGGVSRAFDIEFARSLLADQRYRPFRDGIITAAKRVQQGVKMEEDALLGNSEASLHGAGTGEATQT